MHPSWLKDAYNHNFECGYTTLEAIYTLLHIPQFPELYNGDKSIYQTCLRQGLNNKVAVFVCINNGPILLMCLKYSGPDVATAIITTASE